MDVACSDHRRRIALRLALLAAGVALSGCSGGSISDSFPSFGTPAWFSRSEDRSALAAAPNLPSMEDDCPSVDIRGGAGTLSIATKQQQATANDLRYQLSFHRLARQCALDGTTVRMKVGVEGRVLIGPAGAPSQVEVPLRYAVVREGVEPRTIVTKFRRFPVALPPDASNVAFTDIEGDLSFPLPSQVELQSYIVYVGFDEIGDRNERRPPPKKASPRPK